MSTSSDVLSGLTVDQATAAALTGPALVLAGAGTGKTKTLTAGVAHRIARRGIAPARILAVTFTNKAAGEMTARIRTALGESAAPHWMEPFTGSERGSCAASRKSPPCAPASTSWMPTTAAASSSGSCRR